MITIMTLSSPSIRGQARKRQSPVWTIRLVLYQGGESHVSIQRQEPARGGLDFTPALGRGAANPGCSRLSAGACRTRRLGLGQQQAAGKAVAGRIARPTQPAALVAHQQIHPARRLHSPDRSLHHRDAGRQRCRKLDRDLIQARAARAEYGVDRRHGHAAHRDGG